MHQCLRIAEVVSLICANVDGHALDSRFSRPTRIRHRQASALNTLSSLARTCRALQEPALDALWHEISDLFVLIKYLMPAEVLRFDEDTETLFLVRPASDAEWERLDPYVRRIRAVGIATPCDSGIATRVLDPESVLRPLLMHLSKRATESDVLFPDLVHVVYHPFWTHELYSHLLLNPRLRELQVPFVSFTELSEWGYGPDTSEHYDPATFAHTERLAVHILPAVQKMHSLQTVWMKAMLWTSETLTHLGSLPTLTTFALESGWDIGYPPRSQLERKAFSALTQLFVANTEGGAAMFLAHIDPVSLEALTIMWEDLYTDADSSGYFLLGCLSEVSYFKQLQHLTVFMDESMMEESTEQGIAWNDPSLPPRGWFDTLKGLARCHEYLQPLLSMRSLRTLEIGIDIVIQLDDVFLPELARSLPHLEQLSLVPRPRRNFWFHEPSSMLPHSSDNHGRVQPKCLPTLDGIVSLLGHCERLEQLKLAVATTFSDGNEPHPTPSPSRVRVMELWATPLDENIPDDIFVDLFVDTFPALEDLRIRLPMHSVSNNMAFAETTRGPLACQRWDVVVGRISDRLHGLRVHPTEYRCDA
ncbi:hypothetical protein OH77DRAFT_188516 [Trametes cingulata]|nr:hypothetical protein OH77DRAFT_188516 [Trametes cingulata]